MLSSFLIAFLLVKHPAWGRETETACLKILSEGISVSQTSVSMTTNGTLLPGLAAYIAVERSKAGGFRVDLVSGAVSVFSYVREKETGF